MQTVSVVIPTFKNRGGLQHSINSVVSQDYEGLIEIIIVDDNSPNSKYRILTERLMERYKDNPKVIYLKHDVNKNGAAARNTGIKASNGDFVALLDDDDIFLPGKLTKQINFLLENPKYDAAYCLARQNGKIRSNRILCGNCSRDIFLLESNFFTPTLIFRREALLALNGFDESFRRHQDYELLLRFFNKGYQIGCVPEVLTEIGTNLGENILSGKALDKLKEDFFVKFKEYLEIENDIKPGFANQVFAKHYAGVFLNHVKNNHPFLAFKTLKFATKAPFVFLKVIVQSFFLHLNHKK